MVLLWKLGGLEVEAIKLVNSLIMKEDDEAMRQKMDTVSN